MWPLVAIIVSSFTLDDLGASDFYLHVNQLCAWLCDFSSGRIITAGVVFSKMRSKTNLISKKAFHLADPARTAVVEMGWYCAAHPSSPSAVRRPALSIRSGLWIALLG